MMKALEGLIRDDWSIVSEFYPWQEVEQAFAAELARNPHSEMASLIRRAATQFDAGVDRVLVRNASELQVRVARTPRFELKTRVPYVAEFFGSVDGSEWFSLAAIDDGAPCWSDRVTLPTALGPGVHRLQVVVDVTYLSKPLHSAETYCPPSTVRKVSQPQAEDLIEVVRHTLPGISFAILPNLLPTMPAGSVEAGLPQVPISNWLHTTLTWFTGKDVHQEWHSEFCRGEEEFVYGLQQWHRVAGAARLKPRALCLTWFPWTPGNALMAMRLRIGTVTEHTGEWAIETPTFSDMSIGEESRFLDIPFLALLPQLMTNSIQHLPPMDVAVDKDDIRFTPADAPMGAPVTLTAVIRNVGGIDAYRRAGYMMLEGGPVRGWKEFVVDIPVNGKVEVSFRTTMPPGGFVLVQVYPLQPPFAVTGAAVTYMGLIDANEADNVAVKELEKKF